jgi:hypothetical protein
MKNGLLIFLVLIASFAEGQAYEGHYKITSDKKDVGYIVATKKDEGNVVKYEISSDVSIRILFKIQMTNEIQAVFKDGILIYSSATLYLNGNVYSDTKIEKGNGLYTIEKDGHETKIYSDGIRSSSAKLYFHEPIGESMSLSETEGEMKEVDLEGLRKYALTENENSRSVSTYIYSPEGALDRIELVRPYVPELYIYRVKDASEIEVGED